MTPKTKKILMGGSVIAVALAAFSFLQFGDDLVYFYTPSEVTEKADQLTNKRFKVGGLVKPGSVIWDAPSLSLEFMLTDNAGHEFAISHKGTPPDMFKEGQGVVVEGRFGEPGAIISENLMVKHSEEYRKPEDHNSMNRALLEKSLFKNQGTR